MTKDDIIRMAREAGWQTGTAYDDCRECSNFDPERFAGLVAAAEREACARVCEEECIGFANDDEQLNRIAAAIRARGQA